MKSLEQENTYNKMTNKSFIGTSVANCSEAMETRDHLKNGASLKSQANKVNIFMFVLTLFVVVSLGIGLSACDNANAQGSNSNASVRWEYKINSISIWSGNDGTYSESVAFFNELGQEGWEFVGFSSIGNGYSNGQVFKRRLP